ncbi:MAG: hypothetical protein HQ559_04650 [Lentisphaerae bacterium]|nr:hypothetical protein [Lentisphaerota bacterium]
MQTYKVIVASTILAAFIAGGSVFGEGEYGPDVRQLPARAHGAVAYDYSVIADLITAAFTDDEFSMLVFETFPKVHDTFASGMTRTQKTRVLLEWCRKRLEMELLLDRISKRNPSMYARYADRVRRHPPRPPPAPPAISSADTARKTRWEIQASGGLSTYAMGEFNEKLRREGNKRIGGGHVFAVDASLISVTGQRFRASVGADYLAANSRTTHAGEQSDTMVEWDIPVVGIRLSPDLVFTNKAWSLRVRPISVGYYVLGGTCQ